MQRTSVSLPDALAFALRREARMRSVSVSEHLVVAALVIAATTYLVGQWLGAHAEAAVSSWPGPFDVGAPVPTRRPAWSAPQSWWCQARGRTADHMEGPR